MRGFLINIGWPGRPDEHGFKRAGSPFQARMPSFHIEPTEMRKIPAKAELRGFVIPSASRMTEPVVIPAEKP